MIEVELPDGRIVEFPDGTSQDVMKNALMQLSGGASASVPATPQPQETGILGDVARQVGLGARAVGTGLTALPAMIANVPAGAYNDIANMVHGEGQGFRFPDQMQALQGAMSSIGVPEPVNATERVVQDIGSAVTGVGGASSLSKAAPALQSLGQNIGTQAMSAAGSAFGGGTARESGVGPAGQFAASLAGGVAAPSMGRGLQAGAQRLGNMAADTDIVQKYPKVANILQSSSLNKKAPLPSFEDSRRKAGLIYQEAADKGGKLNANFSNKLVDDIETQLLPKPIAGKVLTSEDQTLARELSEYIPLRGENLSLADLQRIDQSLTSKIDKYVVPETGKMDNTGRILTQLQGKIRQAMQKPDKSMIVGGQEGFDAYFRAMNEWKKSYKLNDIENILNRAEMMENPMTGLRTGFRNLYLKNKGSGSYSKEEMDAIQKMAKRSNIGDLLKTFGSRLIPIGSAVTAGPVGAVAGYGASTAMRTAGENLAFKRAENLVRQVGGQSKAIKPPTPSGALGTLSGLISQQQQPLSALLQLQEQQ
jgi:hypothetical protein